MEDQKTEIMRATLECIEKYGLERTTIRKIAEISGKNSAAISYYFRSKELLIDEVLKWNIKDSFSWQDFQNNNDLPVKEQLNLMLFHFAKGALGYPNLVQAHYQGILKGEKGSYAEKEVNAFMQLMVDHIVSLQPDWKGEKLKTSLWLICSNIFCYVGLMPQMFEEFTQKNLRDEETLKAYIFELVERNLAV